ncbi:transposase family protein [Micromonospora chersina]|uniref:transposase family protein n=1 Tax=Micromonospora chersina TaxID=47854 RepID=UPI00379E04C3
MTGLRGDQVAELVTVVFALLGGWQPAKGRRRVLGLYRAVVLTLYLMRRNESQAVAGELFGCSQSTVSRITRRLRPLLRQA